MIHAQRYNSSGGSQCYVSNAGNGYISGTFTTSKGTYVRARGADGVDRRAYVAETTSPQIEDVGEGQLANGRATISIDAALGRTIDARRGYDVFVTPGGDCMGLFVSQKTPAGFTVRELQGGRSSLAFEYRLVARRLATDDERLAVESTPAADGRAAGGRTRSGSVVAAPLTPQARLRALLGPAGYARAMSARRAR